MLPTYISSRGSHNISEVPSLTSLGEATPSPQRHDSYICGRNDSRFQIPDSSFPYVLLLGFFFISTAEKLVLKALFFLLLPLLLSPVVVHLGSYFRKLLPGAGLSSPHSLALRTLTTVLGNPTVLLPL